MDAALELLGREGAARLTVRAAEDAAGLPHGSIRHHFGDRAAMVAALFGHLAVREGVEVDEPPAASLEQWLGAGRILTLARYELFLMAARDPTLRPPLIEARERFVAIAAERFGPIAAPAIVAALDGVVLDSLVRGAVDPDRLRDAVTYITGSATSKDERSSFR
ncbi:MAG: TetR family transcriptional regulator [Actinomycetota bacterium]|nr:TetR family transcriptional regulator [Actinomycetota bacterium]